MNWGYKLMLTFFVFAGMMGYLVFRAVKTEFELVDKDYYKNELQYQQVIDGAARANSLSAQPELTQNGTEIILQMPAEMKEKNISGSILFYCAYNSSNDRKVVLATSSLGKQSIAGILKPGYYTVKISWKDGEKNYYAEKNMTIL